ncbi:MAG TPA: ammonia-forming cytochrome c nitrite reductase subunit c552 [Isosphaeraceae bacterium]|nr:ammonia-forming cytochrome c nitrite reductase subunit c552 [Isosphaeraceae bacterium]
MLSLSRNASRWFGAAAAFFLTLLIVLGVATGRPQQAGGESKDKPASKAAPSVQKAPSKPPPLGLDEEEPLRLDSLEKPASPTTSKKIADNSSRLVCHANFRKEGLAATHASNAVGCSSCHGPSIAHRHDEANITPPDLMFPVESIDSSCARCHEGHDVEPRAVVKRFLERSPGLTDTKSLVCTGCHGEHHLAVRTVHWDRKTGKLVSTGK